jgi:hypothetical protein
MDIYKPKDYFYDSELDKNIVYSSQIKEYSSVVNKGEHAPQASHDEMASTFAEKFGVSGSKLFRESHEKIADSRDDCYFEENDENDKTIVSENLESKQNRKKSPQKSQI